jgi:hypothetical protein
MGEHQSPGLPQALTLSVFECRQERRNVGRRSLASGLATAALENAKNKGSDRIELAAGLDRGEENPAALSHVATRLAPRNSICSMQRSPIERTQHGKNVVMIKTSDGI